MISYFYATTEEEKANTGRCKGAVAFANRGRNTLPAGSRHLGRAPRQRWAAGARVRSCRAGRPFAGPPRAQPHKALALDSVIWYSTCNSNTNIPDVSVARRGTRGRSQSLRGSEERVRRVRSASFQRFYLHTNSVFLNTLYPVSYTHLTLPTS